MSSNGFFLVLDGADGCGKSELALRIAHRLVSANRSITLTREPSDGEIGVLIRRYLRGEVELHPDAVAALFATDRIDHVRRVVEPALHQRHVVVCDRYSLSNRVYRMAETSGPIYACNVCGWTGEPDEAKPLAGSFTPLTCPSCLVAPIPFSPSALSRLAWVCQLDRGSRPPDLTLVLVVSPVVAADRRRRRGGRPEAYDAERFQARCCAAYARAAELSPSERVVFVDADAELEAVEQRVWAVVEGELLSRGRAVDVGGRGDGGVTTVEDATR